MMMFYAITESKFRVPIPNATTWEEAAQMADLVNCGKITIVCCEYELITRTQRVFNTTFGSRRGYLDEK